MTDLPEGCQVDRLIKALREADRAAAEHVLRVREQAADHAGTDDFAVLRDDEAYREALRVWHQVTEALTAAEAVA